MTALKATNEVKGKQASEDGFSWPPSFSLDQEKILQLLTGDRFYSDPSAALREAVLNAIDAVHRRRRNESDLVPKIEVVLNREDRSLTVSDNGIGMDGGDIARLFAKVGASAATEETSKESVGEFGIGVISYFMAGDSFRVETFDGTQPPVALKFSKGMLAGGQAIEEESGKRSQGTTIRIAVRNESTFELLIEKFSYWCRDVDGLSGYVMPGRDKLDQLGADRHEEVEVPGLPEWVEGLHVRPVSDPTGWEAMTGNSKVAVLYRGVFVQEFEAPRVWGIEGSIDVDPKYFKPRLNRESFVGEEFEPEVTKVLRICHPLILKAMVKPLLAALDGGDLAKWSQRRWASLWLSIPRSAEYTEATREWDAAFTQVPAFEIAVEDKWEGASLRQVEELGEPLYVAPHAGDRAGDVIEAAIRLLRNTGRPVIRGLRSDRSWMRHASRSFGTTADLIAKVFSDRFPKIVRVSTEAEAILSSIGKVAPLFTGPPLVDIVRLGSESVPVLGLPDRLVINVDNQAGKAILEDTLLENRGARSLLSGVARHASAQLTQVAKTVSKCSAQPEVLSPIRRRFIRSRTA